MANRYNNSRVSNNCLVLQVVTADFDYTQANTTAQVLQVGRLPAGAVVDSVSVINGGWVPNGAYTAGPTIAGTSWTNFKVNVGKTSNGTDWVNAVDIITGGTGTTSFSAVAISGSDTIIYAGFTPTGGNWNAITTKPTTITVAVLYNDFSNPYGEVIR